MKNIVIFDLDGTLIDTLDSLVISVNKTLEQLQLASITREQCRQFVGNGARALLLDSIVAVQGNCEEELLEKALQIFGGIFVEYCMYQVVPYNGMKELLNHLRTEGFQLAILSNKPHERTVQIVESMFGKGYFAHIQGQCESVPKKPDPKSIEYVLDKIRGTKDECIYIGDSEVDMMTGIAADVSTIGVSWGFRDKSVLEAVEDKNHKITLVDDVESIIEYIFGCNAK
ncbi:MAG: HAD family hydrolase [Eubacteriales bacterium]